MPAAFESPATADLPVHVLARLSDLNSYHRRRAQLALQAFDSPFLTLLLIGRATRFAQLDAATRARMLERCSAHGSALVRLLFNSMRRLVVHTHYGRPEARPARAPSYPWEGPLAGAQPVVTPNVREPVRERVLPAGVIDARSPHAESMRTRVCIIGSGVGGATAAALLAEAGHDVVVLEEGGYYSAADFGDDEAVALKTLYAESGLRSTDEMNVSLLQGRCVGGGSTVNWMVMLRTPERVLEEWRRLGTEEMDAARMRTAFEHFERDVQVHAVPDAAHSAVNRLILDGAKQLGWRAQGGSVNARDCMRVGKCGLGCRYDAKQSALLTQLPRALRAGAQLVYNARARHIARQRGGGFQVVLDTMTVAADVVIVAAGAIGTPLLLQQSGLASEGVGKNLRLHPTTAVVGIYDRPMYASTGIPLTTYCDEFSDLRDGYGHWIETPPLTAGLASIALPGFGAAHRAYMERFEFLAPLIVLARDGAPAGPSAGFVRLRGNDASIRYRVGSADRAAIVHGIESAARIHFACGARSVLTLHGQQTLLESPADLPKIREATMRFGDPTLFSAHVNGTCRIGKDARTSGCRPDGQVHGQPGLYVMDGSLLPTAPGVNPHETIAAVTMILAQKLASAL